MVLAGSEREFLFPTIPGNTSLPFPFPKIWIFSFLFPFPKVGQRIFHSRSQNLGIIFSVPVLCCVSRPTKKITKFFDVIASLAPRPVRNLITDTSRQGRPQYKQKIFFRHCPKMGGRVDPCPNLLALFSPSNTLPRSHPASARPEGPADAIRRRLLGKPRYKKKVKATMSPCGEGHPQYLFLAQVYHKLSSLSAYFQGKFNFHDSF